MRKAIVSLVFLTQYIAMTSNRNKKLYYQQRMLSITNNEPSNPSTQTPQPAQTQQAPSQQTQNDQITNKTPQEQPIQSKVSENETQKQNVPSQTQATQQQPQQIQPQVENKKPITFQDSINFDCETNKNQCMELPIQKYSGPWTINQQVKLPFTQYNDGFAVLDLTFARHIKLLTKEPMTQGDSYIMIKFQEVNSSESQIKSTKKYIIDKQFGIKKCVSEHHLFHHDVDSYNEIKPEGFSQALQISSYEVSQDQNSISISIKDTVGNLDLKIKLNISIDPKQITEQSVLVGSSFWFDYYLGWLAIILSIALYFNPYCNNLNYLFLVADICLFTLNNHFLIGGQLSHFSQSNINAYKMGDIGWCIFYLKLIPLLNYLRKNFLKYLFKEDKTELIIGAVGTIVIISLSGINYLYQFQYFIQLVFILIFYLMIPLNMISNRTSNYYIFSAHPIIFLYIINNFVRVAYVFQYELRQSLQYHVVICIILMLLLNITLIAMRFIQLRLSFFKQTQEIQNQYKLIKQTKEPLKCDSCQQQALDLTQAPCGHKFHQTCLDQILDQQDTCICCQQELPYVLDQQIGQ